MAENHPFASVKLRGLPELTDEKIAAMSTEEAKQTLMDIRDLLDNPRYKHLVAEWVVPVQLPKVI